MRQWISRQAHTTTSYPDFQELGCGFLWNAYRRWYYIADISTMRCDSGRGGGATDGDGDGDGDGDSDGEGDGHGDGDGGVWERVGDDGVTMQGRHGNGLCSLLMLTASQGHGLALHHHQSPSPTPVDLLSFSTIPVPQSPSSQPIPEMARVDADHPLRWPISFPTSPEGRHASTRGRRRLITSPSPP